MENRPRILQSLAVHWPAILILLVLTGLLSFFYLSNQDAGETWSLSYLPLDDNWIHLVYARSLAQDGWFFYNPGVAEAGMSSPLWVILLALVMKLGGGPVFASKFLSILFGVAFAFMVYLLAQSFKLPRWVAIVAAALTLLEPNMSYSMVSGMEVTLTGFTLAAALWAANERRYLSTGIFIGLMVISRGELALVGILLGLVLLLELYLKRESMELVTTEEVLMGLKVYGPALLMGGSWAIYNYLINGHFLPNTYYVKHYYGLGFLNLENLVAIWKGFFQPTSMMGGFLGIICLVLWVLGVIYLGRKKNYIAILTAVIPLVIVYSLSINLKLSPAPWNFFARRYLDFLLPLIALMVVSGFLWLWEKVQDLKRKEIRLLFALLLVGTTGYYLFQALPRTMELANEYSWNCRNITEVDVAMGAVINDQLPGDAVIAVTDAGAMRYFGNRVTIDLLGLNNHQNIGLRLEDILARDKPDYVALFRNPIFDEWAYLEEMWSLSAERNTILGGAELVLYKVDKAALPVQ